MDNRMKESLDRYITGNWGEDQLKDEEFEDEEDILEWEEELMREDVTENKDD